VGERGAGSFDERLELGLGVLELGVDLADAGQSLPAEVGADKRSPVKNSSTRSRERRLVSALPTWRW
jgi:hypothetical protein